MTEPADGPGAVPAFAVEHLTVDFVGHPSVRAVDDASFEVHRGEVLGLVGESGAGKSVSLLASLGLLPPGRARIRSGRARLGDVDLLRLGGRELRRIRGDRVGVVFQDPLTSLHPSLRIVDQIAEAIWVHGPVDRAAARRRAVELLEVVGVPGARRRAREYPHQWSGGMRQRAMIAMAIANRPDLIVADEPTTALDVSTQAQVLDVLRTARRETGAAVVLVTHDLGVVAETADRVAVMQRGRIVELRPVADLFADPHHPHTRSLLARRLRPVRPRPARREADRESALVEVDQLAVHFPPASRGGEPLRAVNGVTLRLRRGGALGIVGESGCGKSTLARAVVGLIQPTAGEVRFEGRSTASLRPREQAQLRARVRIVFQDPFASLNPRRTVGASLAEPLRIHRRYRAAGGQDRVAQLLAVVGLDRSLADRRPSQLSGGQRQRVAIARALALEPEVLVLDEPVSSLDLPVQAQVLALLDRLRHDLGLAYLFISHDLGVVQQVSDEVAVMYAGRVVEQGPVTAVVQQPAHPYTRALLSAIPAADPGQRRLGRRVVLAGDLAIAGTGRSSCPFAPRCLSMHECCSADPPGLRPWAPGHVVACHLAAPRPRAQSIH